MRLRSQPRMLIQMAASTSTDTLAATGQQVIRLDAGWLAAVERVEREGQPNPWSRDQLLAALTNAQFQVWGITRAGHSPDTLCGFAVLARQPFDAELQAITVSPQMRRQGLARALLECLCREAEAWQSERLLLEVRVSNQAAIALYHQLGFVDDGRRPGYYPAGEAGQREDALLMSCWLRR